MLVKTNPIYQEIPSPQDRPVITGRNIAHGNRSVAELALLGGDVCRERIFPVKLTIKQCAALVGVCVPYIAAAVMIGDDQVKREAVITGERNILDAAREPRGESLIKHFARSTPEEWLELSRAIGPAVIWDRMIQPII